MSMLIIKARIPNQVAPDRAYQIANGDVYHVHRDSKTEAILAEIILSEDCLPELQALGIETEIDFESRKALDPREEVSRINRFAGELGRLRREKRGY